MMVSVFQTGWVRKILSDNVSKEALMRTGTRDFQAQAKSNAKIFGGGLNWDI